MTGHITNRAGFVAALPPDDPERKQAEAHARSCPACRQALDEGARLITLLEEASPVPAPTAAALARAAAAIDAETADDRNALRRLSGWAVGAIAVAWLFQLMVGSGFVLDARHVSLSLAVFAVAAASITLLREQPRLALVAIVATSGLLAYLAGTAGGLDAGIGIRCMFRELWAAAISWSLIMVAARRARVPLATWDATLFAGAGALAAHAGQHVACEVPHADAHLLVFHFSAVVLAIGLGAVAFRALSLLPLRR